MELTPIYNDADVESLLEMVLAGYHIEAVSLDLAKPGVAQIITLHLEDGRDVSFAAVSGLLWAEDGVVHS